MIRVYTGVPGAGKTLLMVDEARRLVATERVQVFTNLVGLHFPEAVYLPSVEELGYVGRGLVLLDEAGVFLASRQWHKHSAEVLAAFAQHRKAGLDLFMTSQHIERVDAVVRDICSEEVRVAKLGRFLVRTNRIPTRQEVLHRRIVRVPRQSMALYDTFERVSSDGGGGAESLVRSYPAPAYSSVSERPGAGGDVTGEALRSPVFAWVDRERLWTRSGRRAAERVRSGGVQLQQLAGDEARAVLEEEVRRARWLQLFGLRPDQVPLSCTYARPWARGFDPVTRTEQYRQQMDAEDAVREVRRAVRRER